MLLTKSDKLNRGPASKALQEVKAQLKKMKLQFSIQLFSSLNKEGLQELASVMGGRLNFTLEQSAEFDLDSIPDAEADDGEMDNDEFEHDADDEFMDEAALADSTALEEKQTSEADSK